MVFRLAAKAFYAVTYPGRRFADRIRTSVAGRFGVPVRTVAVGGPVSVVDLDRMDRQAQGEVAREVDGYYELEENEQLATVLAYEASASYGTLLAVTLLPFLVLSATALLVAGGSLIAFGHRGFLSLAGLWLAFSIGAHSFPDWIGSHTLVNRSRDRPGKLVILGAPFGALAVLVNSLKAFRVDALYAAGLVAVAWLLVAFL